MLRGLFLLFTTEIETKLMMYVQIKSKYYYSIQLNIRIKINTGLKSRKRAIITEIKYNYHTICATKK